MDIFSQKGKEQLSKILNAASEHAEELRGFSHLIKGDISGIQDFIFSVKSENAAKVLKGRSFFIQALAQKAIDLITNSAHPDEAKLFYNGGGNFYIFANETVIDKLDNIKTIINKNCFQEEYYLTLSTYKLEENYNAKFGTAWAGIQESSNKDKLKRFSENKSSIEYFEPYKTLPERDWKNITGSLLENKLKHRKDLLNVTTSLLGVKENMVSYRRNYENLNPVGLPFWGEELLNEHDDLVKKVEEDIKTEREKGISEEESKTIIPRKDNLIEFHHLGHFAKKRTGTYKLGILKMDVDSLGKSFRQIDLLEDALKSSKALKWFFEDFMKTMLDEEFEYIVKTKGDEKKELKRKSKYVDNIYAVFTGGDDCFFVGAWDAILEFANLVHHEFRAFTEYLKKDLTISAGVVVVGPKFPIARSSKMAEGALKVAKRGAKNAINIFGKKVKWNHFNRSRTIAFRLTELIQNKGENRAILERLQRESFEFERRAASNQLAMGGSAWRLLYSVRRTASKDNMEELEKVCRDYADAIIDALVKGTSSRKSKMYQVPVAARWAEFLTRKSN